MFQSLFKKIVTTILIWESRIILKRKKPIIIGITGSVGKTSTKDAVYAVLKDSVHVRKSEKSYNSSIGVTLTILGIRNAWSSPWLWAKALFDGAMNAFFVREYPDVLILELGVDRPGDMKVLTDFIKPDIVVLTRLPDMPSHIEYFSSPAEVCEEKFALVRALKPKGVFIYNNDDEKIRSYVQEVRQQSIGFSRYSPSQFTASGDKILYDGSLPNGIEFTITHVNEEVRVMLHGTVGVQNAYNYAAAMAVGSQFDVSLQDAAIALNKFSSPQGRMKIIQGKNKTLIIDDTYNSSPAASERALQTLKELVGVKRKIAVLGDMLELGHFSVREHERVGIHVAESADLLFTIGLRAQKIAESALDHGMSEKNIFQYDSTERLSEELSAMLQEGDIILIKGSQSIRAERITKSIMASPDKAGKLLVRQDEAWLNKP